MTQRFQAYDAALTAEIEAETEPASEAEAESGPAFVDRCFRASPPSSPPPAAAPGGEGGPRWGCQRGGMQ
jgi:hypothetical protein